MAGCALCNKLHITHYITQITLCLVGKYIKPIGESQKRETEVFLINQNCWGGWIAVIQASSSYDSHKLVLKVEIHASVLYSLHSCEPTMAWPYWLRKELLWWWCTMRAIEQRKNKIRTDQEQRRNRARREHSPSLRSVCYPEDAIFRFKIVKDHSYIPHLIFLPLFLSLSLKYTQLGPTVFAFTPIGFQDLTSELNSLFCIFLCYISYCKKLLQTLTAAFFIPSQVRSPQRIWATSC